MGFGNYGKSKASNNEVKYEVIQHLGKLTDEEGKYNKELNIISWNGNEPKFDLRPWKIDEETGERKMMKGITLTSEELEALYNILKEISEEEQLMFELGQVVMTQGIAQAMKNAVTFATEVAMILEKYKLCNWGDTCKEDAELNNEAIKNNERILAVYDTSKGTVWIITEWDRSVTTILFPSEYQKRNNNIDNNWCFRELTCFSKASTKKKGKWL